MFLTSNKNDPLQKCQRANIKIGNQSTEKLTQQSKKIRNHQIKKATRTGNHKDLKLSQAFLIPQK